MLRIAVALGYVVLLLGTAPASLLAQDDLEFQAADGVSVYGTWYRSSADTRLGVIIAFHQAGGSGVGEYGPIVPRLNEAGFDVLAVDQRSGGDRFGVENRTVSARGEETGYCAVEPDLVGALGFVRSLAPDDRLIIWGSSYSAALVLRLAASNPEGVVGALAFSPASGGPMSDCRAEDVSDQIRIPVLALRPRREMNLESSVQQFALFQDQGHRTFVAEPGVHGSSMLVEDRVGGSVEETWRAVLDFLSEVSD